MKKSALLVIDVQNGMFMEGYEVNQHSTLLLHFRELLEGARKSGTPVFYIRHNASEGPLVFGSATWEIQTDIQPEPDDIIIDKKTPDSFYQTNLQEELKKQGITHLVLAGIQTEICVDTTCRSAYSHGYDVTLVSDAHGTWNSSSLSAEQIIQHHNEVLTWFAEIKPVKEIVW